jgi:glutaminyl-tRNA synthetase
MISARNPKKYFRLAPGREVRLRYGYFIRCVDFVKDKKRTNRELHCTYDPEPGWLCTDGRKVQGTSLGEREHAIDIGQTIRPVVLKPI